MLGPNRPLLRALLLTGMAVAPLFALIVWTAYAPGAEGPPRQAAGTEGPSEIPMRAYTWGFSRKVIRVNPNDAVRFAVRSEDIKHGFAINELGINLQLVPGREVRSPEVRVALPEGRYTIHCSIFCGLGHPSMKATLVVGDPGLTAGNVLPWVASFVSLMTVGGFAAFASRSRRPRG